MADIKNQLNAYKKYNKKRKNFTVSFNKDTEVYDIERLEAAIEKHEGFKNFILKALDKNN